MIVAIGSRAQEALAKSGGAFTWLPGTTTYAMAAGEVIWIGRAIAAMHPRAVVVDGDVAAMPLVAAGIAPWRPPIATATACDASQVRAACAALVRQVRECEQPRGFGAMLCGETPGFPFDHASGRVHAYADALRTGNPDAIHASALPLIGLGPGLTPSGDDLVGAALFARRAMLTSETEARRWQRIALRLAAEAGARTHPIGAALLRDMLAQQSFAPLHDLVDALCNDDARRSAAAARALVAIGHSSGWDMLAGVTLGMGHSRWQADESEPTRVIA